MDLGKFLKENNVNITKIELDGIEYNMTLEKVIELIESVDKEEYYLTIETLENLVKQNRTNEIVEFLENILKIIIIQNGQS